MQILTKYKGGSLGNAPAVDALLSPKDAVEVRREFITESPVTSQTYVLTGAITVTRSTTLDTGVWTTSNSSAAVYGLVSAVPVTKAVAGRNIMFETYVAVTALTASQSMFVGLSSSSTAAPITAAGAANGSLSCVGFAFVEGEIRGVIGHAAVVVSATLATGNTAGAYRRLGFVIKGLSTVDWYVDGQFVTTSTTVPTTVLFESYSTAGTANGVSIDWTYLAYSR